MKKRFLAIVMLLTLIISCTGCSPAAAGLLSALEKDTKLTSGKTTEELSGQFEIKLPKELEEEMEPPHIQSILSMLSSFRMESTTIQQMSNQGAKAQSKLSLISDDLCFDTHLFAEVTPENIHTIVKIPSIAKAMVPSQYADANYLSIDMKDYPSYLETVTELNRLVSDYYGMRPEETVGVPEFSYGNIIQESQQLSNACMTFMKEYATCMPKEVNPVEKTSGGYTVTFTDESFKLFLKHLILTYYEVPEAKDALHKFLTNILNFYQSVYPAQLYEPMEEAISSFLNQDAPSLTAQKLQVEMFYHIISPIRILGKDGIQLLIRTNPAGFITQLTADIHLDLDMNAIMVAMEGQPLYDEEFSVSAKLHLNQNRSNINQSPEFSFPKLTAENTLPYFEMLEEELKEQMEYYSETPSEEFYEEDNKPQLPAPDGRISILETHYNWYFPIEFPEYQPFISEENVLYVPMEDLMEYLGLECDWNEETGYLLFMVPHNGDWVWFRPGDCTMYADNYTITLPYRTIERNGRTYLPLKAFLNTFTEWRVKWSQKENAAYLVPYYLEFDPVQE